jgi:hypothetical protein
MNTSHRVRCLLGALCIVGGVASASEAPTTGTPAAVFAKIDADRDDRVSLVEARRSAPLVKAFAKLDTNSDGFLTSTEFQVWEDAANIAVVAPVDPDLTPSGSRGAQHMPKRD